MLFYYQLVCASTFYYLHCVFVQNDVHKVVSIVDYLCFVLAVTFMISICEKQAAEGISVWVGRR